MSEAILIWTNVPDAATADLLAQLLVEQNLAACVNILPPIQSVYTWQGAIERAVEVTLMIKTTQARYAQVEVAIKQNHPCEVPEIIAVPVTAGLPAYLQWVVASTTKE